MAQVLASALGSVPVPAVRPAWSSPAASRSCCSSGWCPWCCGRRAARVALAAAVALVVVARLAAGAAPGALGLDRRPLGSVRPATPPTTALVVANDGRRTRARRWCATPGSRPPARTGNRHRLRLAAGDRALAADAAAAHAPRRPAGRRGHRAACGARWGWPRGSGRATSPGTRALAAAVRVAQAPALAGWRGCASSTAGRRCGSAGQGTEFDSLREYVRGDDVRSIDWRASARNRNVVVRTWQPERDRRVVLVLDTSRTSGRPASTTCPGSTRRWTPRCCSPRSPPGPATGSTSWPATGGSGPGCASAGARDVAAQAPGRDGRPRAGDRRGRLDSAGRRGHTLGRQRALVVLLTPLEPSAVEQGLLPVLPTLTRHHRVVLASVRDPALERLAGGAGTRRRGLRRRRGRAGAAPAPAYRRAARARSASTWSTPTPSGCRRRWPTTT